MPVGSGQPGFVRYYLAPGDFSWSADQAQHITYSHITARSLSQGEIPIWTNYLGGGTPYLQFYGCLFFYAVGLIDLLWRDIFLSLKVALTAAHVGSGLTMYWLLRATQRSRKAAFVAGLAYVLSFWHAQQVLIMGRLPLSLFYALLPLPFAFYERLLATPRRWLSSCLAGGISLGALALTHPGYGFWALGFAGMYAVLRVFTLRPAERMRGAHRACLLLAVGVVFGSYLTLPMWLERGFTGLYRGVSFAGVPIPTWQHILIWSNYRFWLVPPPDLAINWYGGYLGLTLVAAALTGISGAVFSTTRRLQWRALPAYTCLVASVCIAFGYPWLDYAPVHILGAGRYLLFTVFFLALAVGHAAHLAMVVMRRRNCRVSVHTALVLGIIADLGPTTFQQGYSQPSATADPLGRPMSIYASARESAAEFEVRGEIPNHRALFASLEHPYTTKGLLHAHTLTPSPDAMHPGAVRAATDFVSPIERFLSTANDTLPANPEMLLDSKHSGIIKTALAMLNVRHVVVSDKFRRSASVHWNAHTPVLVSPVVASLPEVELQNAASGFQLREQLAEHGMDEALVEIVAEDFPAFFILMNSGVNTLEKTCDRIYLLSPGNDRDLGTQPRVEIRSHKVWNQRVELTVSTTASCFARLAYAYTPT